MTSAANHAARLRVLRNCLGMLCHPQRAQVFDHPAAPPEARQACRDTIRSIMAATPLEPGDLLAYARAARKQIVISWKTGRPAFAFCGD